MELEKPLIYLVMDSHVKWPGRELVKALFLFFFRLSLIHICSSSENMCQRMRSASLSSSRDGDVLFFRYAAHSE